ncbi:MAG: AAC(3)-I family aminoglycoside N-acetyltransferase [Gemmatimonadales bacterium]|nr:MAG: AAC(3)-I family aminoglycoside N-acetyltransferase [Gemmatimonadales bacterium]
MPNRPVFRQLGPDDLSAMDQLLGVFGEAFGEPETYASSRPGAGYLRGLLGSDTFIAIVAEAAGAVVGGIAAYELRKFEQERSEIYLYDLAVLEAYRRQGVATGLIQELRGVAAARGAWVILVQADTGSEDQAAIALYSRLGTREEVLHFDIPVERNGE